MQGMSAALPQVAAAPSGGAPTLQTIPQPAPQVITYCRLYVFFPQITPNV